MQQARKRVHWHTHAALDVKALDAKASQLFVQVKVTGGRNVQPKSARQIGVQVFDGADLFVFRLRLELDQPSPAACKRLVAHVTSVRVVKDQHLGTRTMR